MAATAEARELSRAHMRMQARIGLRATARAQDLWHRHMDLADLDTSAAVWSHLYVGAIAEERRASQQLAQRFLTQTRRMNPIPDPGFVVARPFNAPQALLTANVAGPWTVKSLIARGTTPEEAFLVGMRATRGRAQRWAVRGGQRVIIDSAQASPRRTWRIITADNPCAFCALMAMRTFPWTGAVIRLGAPHFESHTHCQCSTEEITDGEDELTDRESLFIDAYLEAANQAAQIDGVVSARRGQDTVMWRMRRNHPDLFSDGVQPGGLRDVSMPSRRLTEPDARGRRRSVPTGTPLPNFDVITGRFIPTR